jgi:hypothetical protein
MSHNSSHSATKGTKPEETPNQVSPCSLTKGDAPVSVSDVDKLIAYAESINLSEQKETP